MMALAIDTILARTGARHEAAAHRQADFRAPAVRYDYAGGYTVVKDYVRLKRARRRKPLCRWPIPPGHAQVDFGQCLG